MITVPVSASMYQTMVANIQQIHPNGDGTICLSNMQVHHQNINNHNSHNSSNNNNASHQTPTTNHYTINTNSHNTHNGRIRAIMSAAPKAVNNVLNSNAIKQDPERNNNNNNNNNSNSVVIINDKFNKHLEHADAQHTHAIIDEGGNVVIHFGSASTNVPTTSSGGSGGSDSQTVVKTEYVTTTDRSVTAN